jgi:hypothetical protein
MSLWKPIALLIVLPASALAQGGPSAAIDAAKAAGKKEQAGIERTERLVDQQLAEPGGAAAEPGEAPPPEEAAPGGVNLNRAAEKLEGQATEPPPAEAGAAPGAVPPPDTYTVKPGDTLWDLSGRFLNNPWYWPKVWSYNPEIANPHWIYPGNLVKFYPSGEEAPTRVEPVAPAPEPVLAEEGAPTAPKELEDLSVGTIAKAEQLGEDDAVAVVGPYRVGQAPKRGTSVRRDNFVTRRVLEDSGVISAAFEEKLLLSSGDKIYAKFRDPAPVKVGETYAIFRNEGPVRHPVTNEVFGYKTVILGSARVTTLGDRVATLVVRASYDTIERGDLLGPWTERLVRPVAVRPNQASLDGVILALHPSILTNVGEYDVVYVDKGRDDGVEEGNTFEVVRSGDLYGQPPDRPVHDAALPREVVGSLVVFDVKDHASTAFVRRSIFELMVGDRLEMRPGAAKAGSGGF